MNKLCYNSGPISSLTFITAWNNFSRADKIIEDLGMTPINPMERTWGLRPSNAWWLHMVKDIILLMLCHAVFFQKGWKDSRGARIEFRVARLLCKDMYFEST